jgi:hypothetical protein
MSADNDTLVQNMPTGRPGVNPDNLLDTIRALSRDICWPLHGDDIAELGEELAEKIDELDKWISDGGDPPDDWLI